MLPTAWDGTEKTECADWGWIPCDYACIVGLQVLLDGVTNINRIVNLLSWAVGLFTPFGVEVRGGGLGSDRGEDEVPVLRLSALEPYDAFLGGVVPCGNI